MYYRARSEQKPTSPKPPPAAAAKYAPQPPHWVPPGPTGVGGGSWLADLGGGCSVQDPTEIYLQLNFLASLPVGRIGQTEVLQLQE